MDILRAQEKVDDLIKHYGGYWPELSMMARITEETGELARAINIKYGEKRSKFKGDGDGDIKEEISDLIFTLMALSNKLEINLDKELQEKIEKDFEKCKGVYDTTEDKVKCQGDLE